MFWDYYADRELTEEFQNLIESMLALNPTTRPTMADILAHPWMKGNPETNMKKEDFE